MAEVLIGCKLPNGIILELMPLPPTVVKDQQLYPAPAGKRVELKGANSLRTHRRQVSMAVHPYAVTRVDKAFWDEWFERNKELEFIRKGLVFVAQTERDFNAIAKENAAKTTGMEALNPEKDPRLPRSPVPGQTVEADPEALARARAQIPA
jgi:hypothetical protein